MPHPSIKDRCPEIPELTDRLARIAKHPKTDNEEREATAAIWNLAREIRERLPRVEKQPDFYETPVIGTSGLSASVREMAEERWG